MFWSIVWASLEWSCKFPLKESTLCAPFHWKLFNSPDHTNPAGVEAGGGLPPGLGPPWHGEWQRYIRAPEDKSHILPERIYKVRGNVSTSGSASGSVVPGMEFGDVTGQGQGDGILLGMGGSLTVAFKENIGGRVCLDIDSIGMGSEKEGVVLVTLAYSESPWYAGPVPDATTDRQERDLPLRLKLKGKKNGKVCVGKDFVRGSFKYFTISVPVPWALEEEENVSRGDEDDVDGGKKKKKKKWVDRHWLRIKALWVVSTAYPAMKDGRNYTGYFHSSSDLLNRIWYAGAWTLQLSTIDPQEGSALIDYNRLVDHNRSPIGSWYSNFTISNGTSVTTDGAKRDRVVWPGDMLIAVPGIAMSTDDMLSVRNALDVLYDHQYGDGSLPYAGPPMGYHNEFSDTYHMHTLLGTYNYVLYTGDLDYLRSRWEAYLRAVAVSISKVDSMGLLHVSSVADWLRPGMTGHNLEASAILYTVLEKSVTLASWLSEEDNSTSSRHLNLISSWKATQKTIESGLARLYCPTTGLFSDNIGARSCKGPYHIDPQDGNSWVLISKLNLSESNLPYKHPKSSKRLLDPLPHGIPSAQNISTNLRNRWTKFGAPAVEFPNVISPFASGFELLAHCATGNITAAVELILLEWGYLLDGPGFTNSTLAEGFRVDGHMQYPAYPSAARNSHAHGWSSGPTSVLMREVVGIEIAKYGGLVVRFHPRLPGWLGFVRGGFEWAGGWAEVLAWRVREWIIDGEEGGVVVKIAISESSRAGVVSLGGLLEDLWEEEMRKSGGKTEVAPDATGAGEVVPVEWNIDLGLVLPKEENEDKTQGGKNDKENEESDSVLLKFDEDFVPLEMDTTRPAGIVDWDVMEENFRTPVYEGWSVDRLKKEAEDWEKKILGNGHGHGQDWTDDYMYGGDHDRESESVRDILEEQMEKGMGMDGGWGDYLPT
ncbi:Six-hairpin glycosidase-like protein [Naviculisporaceae sp. PSN 640]